MRIQWPRLSCASATQERCPVAIRDFETPRCVLLIILALVVLVGIVLLVFLGYLPSPLSAQVTAHDLAGRRANRAALITCGAAMQAAGQAPLRCFDEDDPRSIFVGTR